MHTEETEQTQEMTRQTKKTEQTEQTKIVLNARKHAVSPHDRAGQQHRASHSGRPPEHCSLNKTTPRGEIAR